jgi:hypothetical protein
MVPAAVFISGIFSAVFQPCDFAKPVLHFCKTPPLLSFDAMNNRGMIPLHCPSYLWKRQSQPIAQNPHQPLPRLDYPPLTAWP